MLDEVLEQPNGVRFLRRVVSREFASPLLLVGEEGTGRRFSVLQATKEMYCADKRESGCRCFNCSQVDRGIHPDVMIVEPDNGEVKVGSIREMIAATRSRPSIGDVKVIIVDGVDKMNSASANAMLKTLEEPPDSVLFFLLAESAARVIPTIRSRCGLVQYQALSVPLIVSVLQRSDPDCTKPLIIARMSEGSVGRAVMYMGAGRLSFRDKVFNFIRLALEKNVPSLFTSIDAVEKELPLALRFLEQIVHDIIMVRAAPTRVMHEDLREEFTKVRDKHTDSEQWYKFLGSVRGLQNQVRSRITRATDKSFPFHVKNLFAQAFWV